VLVLGANGQFGRAAVTAFAAAGWQVSAQVRSIKPLSATMERPGVQVIGARFADTVATPAQTADLLAGLEPGLVQAACDADGSCTP
jgi:uncharacterized protein YbjT (DUF2867 family)